jgi:hypothetical protein
MVFKGLGHIMSATNSFKVFIIQVSENLIIFLMQAMSAIGWVKIMSCRESTCLEIDLVKGAKT